MWFYFNSDGQLIETLTHGPQPRAGTTDFEIVAYFEGKDDAYNQIEAFIRFVKPDYEETVTIPMRMKPEPREFKVMENENPLHFEDGKTYKAHVFDFHEHMKDESGLVYSLLDIRGNWKANISIIDTKGKDSIQGEIVFSVAGGIESKHGSEVPLQVIVHHLNQAISLKASYAYVDEKLAGKLDKDVYEREKSEFSKIHDVLVDGISVVNEEKKAIIKLSGKVDKEEGKTLINENFLTKLESSVPEKAGSGNQLVVSSDIDPKIEGSATYAAIESAKVYTDQKVLAEKQRAEAKEQEFAQAISDSNDRIEDIEEKLPEGDIATQEDVRKMASHYLNYDGHGHSFPTLQSLLTATTFYWGEQEHDPDENDFVYVQTDESQEGKSTCWGYTNGIWSFQHPLSNVPLTEEQTDALNSGITSGKLETIQTDIFNTSQRLTEVDEDLSQRITNVDNAKLDKADLDDVEMADLPKIKTYVDGIGGGKLIDIGSSTEIGIDNKVFPKITNEKANEIYSTFTSGKSVILKWTIFGSLPLEYQVLSSDNVSGNTFDIIVHNEYLCEYTAGIGDYATLKIVKLGTGADDITYATDQEVSELFEQEITNE